MAGRCAPGILNTQQGCCSAHRSYQQNPQYRQHSNTVAGRSAKGHPVARLSLCDVQTSLAPGDDAADDVQPLTDRFQNVTTLLLGQGQLKAPAEDDLDGLVRAALEGDRGAVDGVLRRIRPLVLRYCRARVGSQEKSFASADDVAQEVCLAVFTALPSYRYQGRPFLAFVYGIAAHKVADARRSAARNRAEPFPDVPDTSEPVDGPEVQLLQAEVAERMTKLLDTLSKRQRDILVLRVVVGLSVEETAEAVGSAPGAVRVAQHRALNRLHTVLTSRSRSDHGSNVQLHSTAITSKITERLRYLADWMGEEVQHDRITAATARPVAL